MLAPDVHLRRPVQTPSDKTPSKFKVGDKVRVIGAALEYAGRTGVVTNTYELAAADSRESSRYVVFFIEDGTDAVFYDFELERASS